MTNTWYRRPLAAVVLVAATTFPTASMVHAGIDNYQTIFLTEPHQQQGRHDFTRTASIGMLLARRYTSPHRIPSLLYFPGC